MSATVYFVENISHIAASNAQRTDEGKDLALVVYAVAGLSHVLMSLLVALVVSWRVPDTVLNLMPYAKDVRVATFYWWYAWLSMTFLISCAGGTITMVVILLLYAIIVLYVIIDALCNCRTKCTERHRPPDLGGRSLAAQQRMEWLFSGGIGKQGKEHDPKREHPERTAQMSFLDMDAIKVFEPLPADPVRLPQKEQRKAFDKVATMIKLARAGTSDKKKPWSYYAERNPDGTPSDSQIAYEEAAAWKVRRALGDKTEMTENGQLRDADQGVMVGSKMETAMRLARTLMRYSPGSLLNMEQMLESYRLQEDRLFFDLEKKYGPEPPRLERKKWLAQQRSRTGMSAEEVANTFAVPELPSDLYWTRCPVRPVPPQLAAMIVCGIFIALCAMGMAAAVLFWPIPEYRVVRDDFSGGSPLLLSTPEIKPDFVAKTEFLVYGWPGTASEMRVQQYADAMSTIWYSYIFRKQLTTDQERYDDIKKAWIDAYNIDMSSYLRESYLEYSSVDDWWGRMLKPGARRLDAGWNTTGAIICPTDGRYTAFSNLNKARKFWIKGGRFSYDELLEATEDNRPIQGNVAYFVGGSIVISRLAAADYHRFHSPVSGRVSAVYEIRKHWFSNTPTAVQSGNNVLFNTRWVVLIDTADAAKNVRGVSEARPSASGRAPSSLGVVAYIVIGSTYSGSVSLGHRPYSNENGNFTQDDDGAYTSVTALGGGSSNNNNSSGNSSSSSSDFKLEPGMWIRTGDELGRYHLGGSTVVMLFRAGAAAFDCRVLQRSEQGVETLFQLGRKIGVNRGTVDGDSPDFCS